MPFDRHLLTECPTLYPTEEEFQSPIGYLSREDIKTLGTANGLVKIVPPNGWRPPFSLAQSFTFHTRTQNLGDLSLRNRSRKFFVENMNRFMLMVGLRPRKEWITGFLNLVHVYDSYLAFKELFPSVTDISLLTMEDTLKWNTKLGIESDSKSLLNAFKDKVWPYAQFLASNGDNFNFPAVLTDDPDSCVICSKKHSPTLTLLCDNCDDAYHMKCLTPPLESVPSGQWYCDKCLIGTGEYGFEENPELRYSLLDFVRDCQVFEQDFYEQYATPGTFLTIDQLEQIFWRLVEGENSTIKVKYGADIHNENPGEVSGFPTFNFPPQHERTAETEKYARHPCNLTRLPFANGSLLNHIKTKISGMTVPWLYVGSLLSTFCWHVEDHYTLSANYCHFGNVKNWYGIPSEFADKFEEHMKSLAPDLFQRQPDLLHQLVTLISPSELAKIGIPTVYARQGPNEFVVTFPRVYHAGFNCGFNLNEAVNFSMDCWLSIGEKAVEDYRIIRKENVFDHYSLVENILESFLAEDESLWQSRLDLVRQCITSLQFFTDRQAKLVKQLKSERLLETHESGQVGQFTPEQEQSSVFEAIKPKLIPYPKSQGMKAMAIDNDDKLCDICRTYLSHQYCKINNKLHRFGKWNRGKGKSLTTLLTPGASPNVPENQFRGPELAFKIAKAESNDELQKISRFTKDSKDEHQHENEREESNEDPDEDSDEDSDEDYKLELDNSSERRPRISRLGETPNKKQRTLRSSVVKEPSPNKKGESPALAAIKPSINFLFRELNRLDNILLCLRCTMKECGANGERVPRGSQIIYEKEFDQTEAVLNAARAKVINHVLVQV